jgi:uncharacterized C2H2 Zn-finger protein
MNTRERLPLSIEGEEGEQLLLCPKCKFNYTHMTNHVIVNKSSDYTAHPNVRGTVISLPGFCENHHAFVIYIGQHKGRTYVWTEFVKDLSEEELEAAWP